MHSISEGKLKEWVTQDIRKFAKFAVTEEAAHCEAKELEQFFTDDKDVRNCMSKWIESIKRQDARTELNREILLEFVDYIVVYEKSTCQSQKNISIVYKN